MTKLDFVQQMNLEMFVNIMLEVCKEYPTREQLKEKLSEEITEEVLQRVNEAAQYDKDNNPECQPVFFVFKQ